MKPVFPRMLFAKATFKIYLNRPECTSSVISFIKSCVYSVPKLPMKRDKNQCIQQIQNASPTNYLTSCWWEKGLHNSHSNWSLSQRHSPSLWWAAQGLLGRFQQNATLLDLVPFEVTELLKQRPGHSEEL